jgi:hypothetical protein
MWAKYVQDSLNQYSRMTTLRKLWKVKVSFIKDICRKTRRLFSSEQKSMIVMEEAARLIRVPSQ